MSPNHLVGLVVIGFAMTLAYGAPAPSAERYIVLASTTSTQNSGLFEHLLPQFTRLTGIEVRVVAVGSGQALRLARNGDADVVLVHDRPSEEAFVAEGHGVKRHPVMYNDFVIVGPAADPAGIRGLADAVTALARIGLGGHPFVSRGDDSGTHQKEREIWSLAGIDAKAASGTWYREVGAGMGATLNAAAAMPAYTLADRGTWLAFKNRGPLVLLVEGDRRLANPYGVILVNPARHPHVKAADGQAFIDWLVGPQGRTAIAAYTIDGRPLFFPDAWP